MTSSAGPSLPISSDTTASAASGESISAGKKRKEAASNEDASSASNSCPYLDTINRSVLDFDFEPSCSVTLESGPHVYGCLVCGKFFRGRGRQTPAYTHSVDEGHFVYVHLSRGTFHCLPDDYEIVDPSLADISAALHPTFTADEIARLDDANAGLARDLFGRRYLPGFVGLNNLNKTDGVNAIVQALAHVRPLRDFFLQLTHKDIFLPSGIRKKTSSSSQQQPLPLHRMSHLAQCFGELVRKIWSNKRFKSHVDPHMLIQAVSTASNKRFRIGQQQEAGEFMAWLLHQLHIGVGGTKKPGSSIIHRIFQGKVQVTTLQQKRRITKSNGLEDDDRIGSDDENTTMENEDGGTSTVTTEETTVDTQFLQLTLDIPEKPLFRDEDGGLVIPQEPLVTVLKKFDGLTFSDVLSNKGSGNGGLPQQKRYRLLQLPNYLILHLSRFRTNRYSREKNPTIVMFPVKNLDLSEYVHSEHGKMRPPTEEQVRSMSVKELKNLLIKHGRSDIAKNALERSDLVEATIDFVTKSLPDLLSDKYDLVANITHDNPADVGREGQHDPLQEGSYRCHVQHRGTKQWYEIQDLHVQETMPQLIGLSESYILIFERRGQRPI